MASCFINFIKLIPRNIFCAFVVILCTMQLLSFPAELIYLANFSLLANNEKLQQQCVQRLHRNNRYNTCKAVTGSDQLRPEVSQLAQSFFSIKEIPFVYSYLVFLFFNSPSKEDDEKAIT